MPDEITPETTTQGADSAMAAEVQRLTAEVERLDKALTEARDEAAKRRIENKPLAEAAKRVPDLEAALTAAEAKASENATRATNAEALTLRYEVAAAKGLDLKLATRLKVGTREEIEADADALLESIQPPAGAPLNFGVGWRESSSDNKQTLDSILAAAL